ncbi:uncharacterized protein [Typha latifolia]|uniref:uncharacterized protein n=1 Tax=Typha latifolia TaxID=4733 RepID=UPI003C2F6577
MQDVNRLELLLKADDFFQIAKRFIVGLILNFNDRKLSQPFFLKCCTSMLSRGMDTLKKMDKEDAKTLVESVNNIEFDQSILLWHIASDLCYHSTVQNPYNSTQRQRISKELLDYMLYLLIVHRSMLTAGIGQIRYGDTCAEAKQFFDENDLQSDEEKKACEELLKVDTRIPPAIIKGDASKSVLFDAVILAKELLKLEEERRWELMSRVWVEMLCFTATHCRGFIHAKQLSDGGELLTFVWLLTVHLGMGDQYMIEQSEEEQIAALQAYRRHAKEQINGSIA